MSSYAETLIDRFRLKGLLIDTNLLLLHAVGSFDSGIVERAAFNRLAAYDVDDYALLRNLMSLFSNHVTTPHVLSEVSNWIGKLPQNQEIDCLSRFAHTFAGFTELRVQSLDIARDRCFSYLGLTDAGIARFASQYLVLTDDARFVSRLTEMKLDALNINHLRQEVWLRQDLL